MHSLAFNLFVIIVQDRTVIPCWWSKAGKMQYLVVLATESGGSALQSLVLRGWQAVHRVGLELERGLGLISTAVSGPERLAGGSPCGP